VPEELKIVVSAPGAEQTTSALRKLHQAERELSQAIGAAAKAEAADVNKAAAAKKGAAAAAGELSMRHKSLLREMAMLSPECMAAAQAINAFQQGLSGAALGLTLVTVGIMAVSAIYSRLSQAQAAEKKRIEDMTAALQRQAEVYAKIAESAEKAARTRRGAGVGAGARLAERLVPIAPPGVGPAAIERAGGLAALAGRGVTDEELQGLAMMVTLGEEPEKGTDRAKARRMLGGMKYEELVGKMATVPRREAGRATIESIMAAEGMTPRGEIVERMELVGRGLAMHPGEQSWMVRELIEEIKSHPERGMEFFRPEVDPMSRMPGYWRRRKTGAVGYEQGITIIERQVFGGVHYNSPESDAAGIIQRSGQR